MKGTISRPTRVAQLRSAIRLCHSTAPGLCLLPMFKHPLGWLRRPQQVSCRGLVPRLSIGTLQLSIRCSSIHFLPKRSFPVSTVEIRLVSGCLAACDCSCAMAGDSAPMMSEDPTPSKRLREEGRMMGALFILKESEG